MQLVLEKRAERSTTIALVSPLIAIGLTPISGWTANRAPLRMPAAPQSSDPKAKEKFAEVSAAYEILGDEKKRGK